MIAEYWQKGRQIAEWNNIDHRKRAIVNRYLISNKSVMEEHLGEE
jgi:hypothetical protein